MTVIKQKPAGTNMNKNSKIKYIKGIPLWLGMVSIVGLWGFIPQMLSSVEVIEPCGTGTRAILILLGALGGLVLWNIQRSTRNEDD